MSHNSCVAVRGILYLYVLPLTDIQVSYSGMLMWCLHLRGTTCLELCNALGSFTLISSYLHNYHSILFVLGQLGPKVCGNRHASLSVMVREEFVAMKLSPYRLEGFVSLCNIPLPPIYAIIANLVGCLVHSVSYHAKSLL